jgi:transposase
MSPSAGANRAAGRMLLQRPSRALPIPPRTGQPPPVDHRRPRETETGNIVRRSVERTFSWLNRCRRLAKDFEHLARTALAFLRLAMIRLMLRRLARPSAVS